MIALANSRKRPFFKTNRVSMMPPKFNDGSYQQYTMLVTCFEFLSKNRFDWQD